LSYEFRVRTGNGNGNGKGNGKGNSNGNGKEEADPYGMTTKKLMTLKKWMGVRVGIRS
jgi:hypothetical protein